MRTSAIFGVLTTGLALGWSSDALAQLEQTGPTWLTSRDHTIVVSSTLKAPLSGVQDSATCACSVLDCASECDVSSITGDTLIVVDTVLQDTESDAVIAFHEALQTALGIASDEALFWEDVEVVVTDLDIPEDHYSVLQDPSVVVYRWQIAQEGGQTWVPARVWVPGDPTP